MKAIVEGVRIKGFRAVVPKERHSYLEDHTLFTEEESRKLYATIGVAERRLLPRPYMASDMCVAAAEGLMRQLDWDPASVDLLIFVSQDADYVLPVTAAVMQRRLGLPTTAAAFDVPLGCSGFAYGTWMAARLLGGSTARRALVLAGDNSARWLRPDDRATLPLFGDAGSATALEVDAGAPPIHAILGTDGSGAKHIFVKAGGKRDCLIPGEQPWSEEEHKRLYRDARLHLNGAEVFTFTLRSVPPLLREAMEHAGVTLDDLDMIVPHQANRMMLDHIRKKIGAAPERFLIDMEKFGNTSSASVPLAICHRMGPMLAAGPKKLLMAGFGVGWSWGTLVAEVGPIAEPTLAEMPDDFAPLEV
ncbi:3-oxoacyl-[acyl-carrier-protein] synthase-3 [Nitrospirillum amazonense]|uniref:3-oxoacyl-[acyl-carrier-protein] synthase-3 n=1 Tax=Nitrospirillum amazonense TaxID=28077 RepID=A0A560FBM8_9PROT|nr:ketoacyl-ACP synthase III [Nitrospirillum amazonense]TWB18975.1 3-oxoacyl-[acyl-carrier-protein] synthase-3 [Nitrospirillum amazonense]